MDRTLAVLAKSEGGWRAWLTNAPLLVRLFNVALTVPLGVYLRRWYRRGFWTTTLAGFGLSLAFELTQLTALWGLYPMRYRSFDVDDLIANTLGASLGWVLAPLVVLLPLRRRADDLPAAGRASPARRLTALAVDGLCWVLVYLVALFAVIAVAAGADYRPPMTAVLLWTASFVLVFAVVPALAGGATPGRALVGIGVRRSAGGRAALGRLLWRELVLLWPVAVVPGLGGWVADALPDRPEWTLLAVIGMPLAWLLLLGLIALARPDRASLPDLLAGTRVVVSAAP